MTYNWPVNEHRTNGYERSCISALAKNSLSILSGEFVKIVSGLVDRVAPWDKIMWVSITKKDFTSTNETIAKKEVVYSPCDENDTFIITTDGGELLQADVGSYFDVKSLTDHRVDYATKSTTAGQLKLIRVLSSSTTTARNVGEYQVVTDKLLEA